MPYIPLDVINGSMRFAPIGYEKEFEARIERERREKEQEIDAWMEEEDEDRSNFTYHPNVFVDNGDGSLFFLKNVVSEDNELNLGEYEDAIKDVAQWGAFDTLTTITKRMKRGKKKDEDGNPLTFLPKMWLSNACGKLFIFSDVPVYDDGDIYGEWWDANDIDSIVENNQNSCCWGKLDFAIFNYHDYRRESTRCCYLPEGSKPKYFLGTELTTTSSSDWLMKRFNHERKIKIMDIVN